MGPLHLWACHLTGNHPSNRSRTGVCHTRDHGCGLPPRGCGQGHRRPDIPLPWVETHGRFTHNAVNGYPSEFHDATAHYLLSLMFRPTLHLLAIIRRAPVLIDRPGRLIKGQLAGFPTYFGPCLRRQADLRIQTPRLLLRGKKTGHMTGIAPPAAAPPPARVYFVSPAGPPPPATVHADSRNTNRHPAAPASLRATTSRAFLSRPPSSPDQTHRPSLPIPRRFRPGPVGAYPPVCTDPVISGKSHPTGCVPPAWSFRPPWLSPCTASRNLAATHP